MIRVNRLVPGVEVLGPGSRLGVWVQGCGLACPGCASVDTWDPNGGTEVEIGALVQDILSLVREYSLTGITLTGGEPVDQADSLAVMLDELRCTQIGEQLDVLLFTGYPLPVARSRGAALLDRVDTLVAGPYRADLPPEGPLRASRNQTLTYLTEKGEQVFEQYSDVGRIQLVVHDGELTMVGLPASGDLDRFRDALRRRGVELGAVSWQM